MGRFKLIKASSPGWEKEFPTKGDATKELHNHICKSCLSGELEYVDSEAENGMSVEKRTPPDPHSLDDLLATPCGCEYWFEDRLAPR